MHKHVRRSPATASKLVVGALAATALAIIGPATATTTVTGGDPGTNPPVVRDSSVGIAVDTAALNYYRSGTATGTGAVANKAYAASNLNTLKTLAFLNRLCRGNNPAGAHNSARTVVTVTDPNGGTTDFTSPARDVSITGNGNALATQPAPADTNYIGDHTTVSSTAVHGFTANYSLAGKPSGVYTVTTRDYPMTKSDTTNASGSTVTVPGACVQGRPDPATGNKTVITGPVTSTTTFEYRPWQYEFTDVFGNGKVQANVIPRENKFKVGATTTPIYAGTPQNTTFYTLPSSSSFSLPSDPSACAADPASCLPSAAVKCEPGPGCAPRIMIINEPIGKAPTAPNGLVGVFDLQTKAFIALAKAGGSQRTLASLGTDLDAQEKAALTKLVNQAALAGIDAQTLLNTKVQVSNGQYVTSLSLLNALQIDPTTTQHGITIVSDATAQAGLILGIYIDLLPNSCTARSATNTSANPRFTPSGAYGWNVERSDLIPDVPAAGPLGTIAGGPVFHIFGKMRTPAQGALADTFSAVLGADTAANEPNGYPVWLEPFVAAGAVASPRSVEFLGTATWSASETPILTSCLNIDFFLGTGVAVYNNPLGVTVAQLLSPLYKPSAQGAQLNAALKSALQQATDPVTTNPQVSALLSQILGALPL